MDTVIKTPVAHTSSLTFFNPEPVEEPEDHFEEKAATNNGTLINLIQCLIISFTGFPLGWDVGTMGHLATLNSFKNTFGTDAISNPLVLGTIVSILNLGCLLGAAILGRKSHIYGFRRCIWIGMGFYLLGTCLEIISVNVNPTHWCLFTFGRLLCGVCIGIMGVVGPVYVGNIVRKASMKKMTISWHQNCCCAGILLGNVVIILFQENVNLANIVCIAKVIFFSLIVVLISFVPEFVQQQQSRHSSPNTELTSLRQKKANSLFPFEVFNESFFVKIQCCLVMALQQLSGINFFFYYSSIIFTGVSPFVASAIMSSVNCGSSLFSGFVLEKVGTRKSLVIGSIGMLICMIIFATIGDFRSRFESANGEVLTIVIISIYIVLFALSWGPGASILVNEISSSSESMAAAVCANWLANFVVSICTPILCNLIGYNLGFVFAFFLLLSAIFVQCWKW